MQLGFTIQSQEHSISPDAIKNVLAMTGKGSVIRWMEDGSRYHPGVDQYDYTDLDSTIAACEAAGLPLCLPIHNLASAFVTAGTGNCSGKHFIQALAIGVLAGVLATRYQGKQVWYESFNEGVSDGNADCDLAYTKDPHGAVSVMQAVYQAVKAVDSSIIVGGPAFLKIEQGIAYLQEWLGNLFESGAGAYMDYLALHYYPGVNTSLPTLQELWQAFQAAATKAGYPQLKLRITEYGFPRGHVTPQQQHDLTLAVLAEGEASNGFIEAAYYYTASENDGYSPYDKSMQYPLYAGFQQVTKGEKHVTTLENYPNLSQRSAKINGPDDCVSTSIIDGMEYLTGQSFAIDTMMTAVYGPNYVGFTSAKAFVPYCAEHGVKLFPIDGNNTTLVQDLHQQIQALHPCLLTEPDPYAPLHPTWSHVLSVYQEAPGTLTARDPYSTVDVTHSDAEWAQLLQFREIWAMERIEMVIDVSMPEVAAHFTAVSGTMWKSLQTGKIVGNAILTAYQGYGNSALCGLTYLGLPKSDEIPIQNINPVYQHLAGKGIVVQYFECGTLVYDPAHLVDTRPGLATSVYPAHIYDDNAPGLDPAIPQLEAEITQLKASQGNAQVLADMQQVKPLATSLSAIASKY